MDHRMVHLRAAGVDDPLAGAEKLPAEQIADAALPRGVPVDRPCPRARGAVPA